MNTFVIKGLLLDLSGTLYSGEERIEGTRKCIEELTQNGFPFRFLTNTTTKSKAQIAEKLMSMGIETEPCDILTPMDAAKERIKNEGFKTAALFMADDAKNDLGDLIETEKDPDVVVIGDLGKGFDYATLNRAFRLLSGGSAFYALARNRCFESGGELFMDMGPFIEALAYASRKDPLCLGKPSADFFDSAVRKLGISRDDVAVVGDDLESDVVGAMNCGLQGILVRTGKFDEKLLSQSKKKPTAVINSIAELPSVIVR